jgi:hypothetical protein
MMHKVRPKGVYMYDPSLVDRCEGRTYLSKGDLVRVLSIVYPPPITADVPQEIENLRGWTQRCYVETLDGKTVTLCACDSLVARRSDRAKKILAELRLKSVS